MNDPETLRAKAVSVLGTTEPIVAVGIFGMQNNYLALTAGGVVGGSVGGVDGGLVGGIAGNAVGMHAARELNAENHGVTLRMLVAITATELHILDWETGSGPTRVLRSFDRASLTVEIKKFGLSRRLHLTDSRSGESLALTGSASVLSAEAKGDKAVLAALA